MHTHSKLGDDKACYYAKQIAASQFSDKSCDASSSVAHSCNCEFSAIWRYISETVQASTIVTLECDVNMKSYAIYQMYYFQW